jgi:hypothetical protein
VIRFDTEMNEYQIAVARTDGRRVLIVYHCPFCGGAAPPSARDELFSEVTTDEVDRVRRALSIFKTLEDAIAGLGPPDEEHPGDAADLPPRPGQARRCRTLKYTGLSKTADVMLVDHGPPRGLGMRLFGKRLDQRSNVRRPG